VLVLFIEFVLENVLINVVCLFVHRVFKKKIYSVKTISTIKQVHKTELQTQPEHVSPSAPKMDETTKSQTPPPPYDAVVKWGAV
jgi:hypothetical protein